MGWLLEWGGADLCSRLPQTGQVLAEEPVLQLQDLKREAGGGYSCLVSAPSVPGLNGSSTVNVTISGEALSNGISGSEVLRHGEGRPWGAAHTPPFFRLPMDGAEGAKDAGKGEHNIGPVL